LTREALWPYALEVYGRPGVEPLLLALQDAHGQCPPFLLWSLWLAASGRPAAPAKLAAGAELARAWQDAAVAPLRTLRRDLKRRGGAKTAQARSRIRDGVKALELEAERMLLQMLEKASPAPAAASTDPLEALRLGVGAWGGEAPPALLDELARLAA
jgi:uncharacterized protein (TIGR02444 family)